MRNATRYFAGLSMMALVVGLLSAPVRPATGDSEKDPASVIRVTPPAPVFDEGKRLAELAERRARVARTIGPKAILVLFSTEPRVYANDVDYEYRQENNLYYLTNLKQKGATLVLMPGNPQMPEVLFLPRRNPRSEVWTGHMYSSAEASQASGIKEIWEAGEFEPFMRALRTRQAYRPKAEGLLMSNGVSITTPAVGNSDAAGANGLESLFAAVGKGEAELYLLVPPEGESREYRQEQNFAVQWARSATGFNVRNASPTFAAMRLRKSPMELEVLQHAIDITIEAHERAQTIANRAQWEYEVDSEVVYTYKRRNADHWGYPSIVGCGPSATTLHYIESQAPVKSGDLLLMDVGAEYDHYTADVTRTFPVNGKFSPLQAEVYQIVYDAQEAAAKQIRPGATIEAVQKAATEVIKNGLLKLGLITDVNSNQYRIWYMHGSSHWLGMNVHDVGNYSTPLEPGMVFTNEPGIYVRLDALENLPKNAENEKFIAAVRPAFEKYKGIGVRIEDDIVVTADGCRWMTAALPRSIADIESFIAKARREQLR
ncbi:MAG TPA: aminopeptidase P family protein [Pyrinomonadaceae bacterium]|jgi:Xaa-Pro aminopeptidase